MQQGTNIPITGKLYDDETQITDLSSYDFDALIVCTTNNERLFFSSRDYIQKDGDIEISGDKYGLMISGEQSSRLEGKCYMEVRVWKNDEQMIGVSKETQQFFNVERNDIHDIC